MINLPVVLGLSIVDKICGVSPDSAKMIAESVAMNRETQSMVLNISRSTNEIGQQIATSGRLLAEQMKNDNLRRFKQIENERRKILNS